MKFPTIALSAFLAATVVTAEESGGSPQKPAPEAGLSNSTDEIYSLGKSLFDTYAPDSIKAEYDFISPEAFSALTGRVRQNQPGPLCHIPIFPSDPPIGRNDRTFRANQQLTFGRWPSALDSPPPAAKMGVGFPEVPA
jgi:hypothetical protein